MHLWQGTFDNTISQMSESPGYAHGGGPWEFTLTSAYTWHMNWVQSLIIINASHLQGNQIACLLSFQTCIANGKKYYDLPVPIILHVIIDMCVFVLFAREFLVKEVVMYKILHGLDSTTLPTISTKVCETIGVVFCRRFYPLAVLQPKGYCHNLVDCVCLSMWWSKCSN